jgi:prepilin peptidase CpaA
MNLLFFPGPVFGWMFCVVLVGLLGTAAYCDCRTMIVPKALTLTALPLGLLFNVMRGGLLGAQGLHVWTMPTTGLWTGAADGLLFGLSGFFAGFGLFLVLWLLGTCGGGDVKLFAALGAWIGAYLAVIVLIGTLFVVALQASCYVAASVRRRGVFKTVHQRSSKRQISKEKGARPRSILLTYSLPLTVTTAAVLLWTMRVELQLAPPGATSKDKVEAHAR